MLEGWRFVPPHLGWNEQEHLHLINTLCQQVRFWAGHGLGQVWDRRQAGQGGKRGVFKSSSALKPGTTRTLQQNAERPAPPYGDLLPPPPEYLGEGQAVWTWPWPVVSGHLVLSQWRLHYKRAGVVGV